MNIQEIIKTIDEPKGWLKLTPSDIRNLNDYCKKLKSDNQQLILSGVVNCVYVITERDNYGEQLFKQVFASREKAVEYLAEQGLKEGNVDEINEIDLD